MKTHLAHIYDKLDARNRNEALGRAMALGLLSLTGATCHELPPDQLPAPRIRRPSCWC